MPQDAMDFSMGAEAREVVQALQTIVKGQGKVIDGFRKMGDQSKGAKKDFKSAFGEGGAALKGMVTGLVGVGAALGSVRAAMADIRAERERAAQGVKGAEFDVRALAQLSGGDSRNYKRMLGMVDQTRIQAGVDKSTAARLQFQLGSLGFNKEHDRQLFASLYDISTSTGDPAMLARGVGKLQSAMGKGETGGARNIINKMMAATAGSDISAAQIAVPAARAAQAVKAVGTSDEEYLAVLAELAKSTGSPEDAATQLRALSVALGKKGFEGKGLLGGVAALEGRIGGRSQKSQIKFLGEINAFNAYKAILGQREGMQALTTRLGEVDRETGAGDYLDRMIAVTGYGPEGAAKLQRVEEQKRLITEEAQAVPELRRQAMLDAVERRRIAQGQNAFSRWGDRMMDKAYVGLRDLSGGASAEEIERFSGQVGPKGGTAGSLQSAANALNSAAQAQKEVATGKPTTVVGGSQGE